MAMKKESLNHSYKDLQPQKKNEESEKIIDEVTSSDYKYGFVTDIDTEVIPKGLNEERYLCGTHDYRGNQTVSQRQQCNPG